MPIASVQYIPNPLLEAEWNASEAAAAMMLSIGERVKAVAASLAPVQTGALKSSISYDLTTTDGGDLMVLIGTSIRYGGFVEFGTSKMAAEPYLRPALDQVV